jgi:predicted metal-dependent phosphoesterase TrpH
VRVDYHFHTSYSYDCDTGLDQILAAARRAGLTRLCVTDHDTIEGALRLRELAGDALEVIVGCEFTCDDGSHVIGLGLSELVPERRPLPLMDRIHAQGGKVLLPHLFRRGSGLFRPELRRAATFVDEALRRADLVECFNGRDTFENNARSRELVLSRGLPGVASSDAHRPGEVGSVFVEYAAAAVDGRSPRAIHHPTQREVHEHPLKRLAMELYHRNAPALPAVVRHGYRRARRLLRRDDAARGRAPPALQYALGATEEGRDAG